VQWPFGYGLSYTTFEYSDLIVDQNATTQGDGINVSFEVKNTGVMAADEIAQIYLSPTSDNQQIRPIQLQGFARVSLQPGESKTIKALLHTEQLGYYDQRQWHIAPGAFIIKIGASSADIRLQKQVTLKGEPVQKPLREYYFSDIFIN
jgi:beta-glucosidase